MMWFLITLLYFMQSDDLLQEFQQNLAIELSTENASPSGDHVEAVDSTTGPDGDLHRPRIVFRSGESEAGQLVRTTQPVTERWLVSETWCANCPAAKQRFLASGGDASHVITIAEALSRHSKTISGVPAEFVTTATRDILQPPSYRTAVRTQTTLDGQDQPPKSAILGHLRKGGSHQGKHWQAWYLESWKLQQLYALHDDDHAGVVPTFDATGPVEAVIENAELTVETVAEALGEHLATAQGLAESDPTYGTILNIDVDAPQSVLELARRLLVDQKIDLPSAGVSANWSGDKRRIDVASGAISLSPGVAVSVKKYGVRLSATLERITFPADLSTVTLELSGAPDLTVRFQ